MTSRDDEAWRAIVDNYGERPELDPDAGQPDGPYADPAAAPLVDPADDPTGGPAAGWDDPFPDADWSEDRFVPPPPPPVPRTTRDRYLAWAGVLGSPVVLLLFLVLGIGLPTLVAYALVAGFVGGFLYLVWRMPRGPRDPDDDGAVL